MNKTLSYSALKFILFSVSFLFFSNSYSQEGIWGDPVAVTDSVTNNRNPNIITFGGDTYMFWEKSSNESSTAIYMKNLSDMGEPIAILEDEGIHYKNPQFINFSSYNNTPDTIFYLFYECDIEGTFDLYYIKYSQDGNFTEPFDVFISYMNNEHLNIFDNLIVWEAEEIIFSKELVYEDGIYSFANFQFLDNESRNPSPGNNAIAYEREVNGHSHIYQGTYTNSNYWISEELFTEGENTSVSLVTDNMYENVAIIWESYQDELWQLYLYDFFDDEITALGVESPNKLHPNGLYFNIPLKKTKQYSLLNHLTYVFDENGNDDIFVNDLWASPSESFNISNSSATDSNPQLFYVWINYKFNTYLLWESNRNGHQQIFMSKIWFTVDTKEEKKNNFSLQTSPNPFHDNLSIRYSLTSTANVELNVYTENGKHINRLINTVQRAGNHKYIWNAKDKSGNKITAGLYIIKLQLEDKMISKKVIVQ